MKRSGLAFVPLAVTGFLCLVLGLVLAVRASAQEQEAFHFVAIGDMPYEPPAEQTALFEELIETINRDGPAFTIHIGDIKRGSASCADDELRRIRRMFDAFEGPLVYTPGDNDWTDCERESAGGFDPVDRLAYLRSLFFTAPESLGRTRIPLFRQSDLSGHEEMVENARWRRNGVLFATVHVVGTHNGFDARDRRRVDEFFARNDADIAWIDEAFEIAAEAGDRAVVLAMHAQFFPRLSPLTPPFAYYPYPGSPFEGIVRAITRGAIAFGRPVLVIYGDTHRFVVDQPFIGPDGRTRLDNITRLQVFGDDKTHAVRVVVDPSDPAVFSFAQLRRGE